MDEREFELINIIGAQLSSSQRDLSERMDLSLGMTNMLIRRLITKGYIRIQQLNKKKVEYILTPKGFAEKMRKSVNYTMKTISSISLIKSRIAALVKDCYAHGERTFYLLGGPDLSSLIEMVIHENAWTDVRIVRIEEMPQESVNGVVLVCREGVAPRKDLRAVNVIEALASDMDLVEHNYHLPFEEVAHA